MDSFIRRFIPGNDFDLLARRQRQVAQLSAAIGVDFGDFANRRHDLNSLLRLDDTRAARAKRGVLAPACPPSCMLIISREAVLDAKPSAILAP